MKLYWLLLISVTSTFAHTSGIIQSLSYHDIQDEVTEEQPGLVVSIETLFNQFLWLRRNGFQPISLDDLIAAREGKRPLPPNPVIITFDDGLRGVYDKAFPLLKLFKYPAVVAPVVSWIESEQPIAYEGRTITAHDLLTWAQLKEMSDSGLVEVASHSYNLHHGIRANPQDNRQPSLTARRYFPETRSYEDDQSWATRIRNDFQRSYDIIKQKLGKAPRAIIWPYGKYNGQAVAMARNIGFQFHFTLDHPVNHLNDHAIGRHMVMREPSLEFFAWGLRNPGHTDPRRVVHVDIDYLFDPTDPLQQRRNLDILLDRIKGMAVTDVYLQAFADPDADGVADELYFPNRELPMRGDLFNRVAWQLKTKCGVRVYAWMPVTAFRLAPEKGGVYVTRASDDPEIRYDRLSIFDPHSRELVFRIYEDLAKYTDFDGILFHDDAFFRDDEDASAPALAWYREQWGLPDDIAAIRADPFLLDRWADHKSRYLNEFTQECHRRAMEYRAPLLTARNIYARLIMQPVSKQWFAQSYPQFLQTYDYTAIMAMPYMEGAKNAETWLQHLAQKAQCHDPGLKKTVFELQGRDWNTSKHIPAEKLTYHMRLIWGQGGLHFGYYPDDFIAGKPELKTINQGFNLGNQ